MRQSVIAICLLAGLGLLLWLAAGRGASVPVVELARVEKGAIADTALASGSLVYAEQVQLRSEVTGRVAQVLVHEGMKVQRGELLMQLEQDAFLADVQVSQAGVRAAELEVSSRAAHFLDLQRQVKRQQQLHERGLVGADAFEQLRSQMQIAEIAIRSARAALVQAQAQRSLADDRLRRSEFRAPIAGLVISVDVKPGETVIAGTVNIIGSDLMVIADPSVLLAELRVDEADIARVALNQSVQVFAAAHPTQALDGSVREIGTSARQIGNKPGLAFRVRVQLAATDLVLFPGMSARAEIQTQQGEAGLYVPVAAVRKDGAGSYVWRLDAGETLSRVDVGIGIANDFSQSVTGALKQGDSVVIGPGRTASGLRAGMRVKAKASSP